MNRTIFISQLALLFIFVRISSYIMADTITGLLFFGSLAYYLIGWKGVNYLAGLEIAWTIKNWNLEYQIWTNSLDIMQKYINTTTEKISVDKTMWLAIGLAFIMFFITFYAQRKLAKKIVRRLPKR